MLPLLELWLSYTIGMVVLAYPVLSLLLPHLDLFYNCYQIVTQPFENALKLKFLELDDYFVKFTGVLDVLIHFGGQHLEVVKDVIANNCS